MPDSYFLSECSAALLVLLALVVLRLALVLAVLALDIRTQVGASRIHARLRDVAGGDFIKSEGLECRQRAAVERGGEGGAPSVGDLGAIEAELLELLQPSSRRRRRACRRRRRRNEGGEALVAKRVAIKEERRQRRQPPQGRREGHQRRVTDGGVHQLEDLESRQGASAQGGGERRGASIARMHANELHVGHGWQHARAQPLRQPLHAVGTGCA
eukprot:scaffold63816_cov63-Phaeocystis_antarctica.AAC.6